MISIYLIASLYGILLSYNYYLSITLNTPKGSVYGHEVRGWDNVIARTLNIENDYAVPGLYPIGCDSIKGDGYSSAYMIGKEIADLALERINRNE